MSARFSLTALLSVLAAVLSVAFLPSTAWSAPRAVVVPVVDATTSTATASGTSEPSPSPSPSDSTTAEPSATSSPTASSTEPASASSCGTSDTPCVVEFSDEFSAALLLGLALLVAIAAASLVSGWGR